MAVKIFFCYAHEDEPFLKKLQAHLTPLVRAGFIDRLWYDRDISAGEEWEQEISKHLNEAHIILLLISPDFMNSDYCYGIEMKSALERHERGEAVVIPVILRHVHWQKSLIAKLQAAPTDGKPVKSWHDEDEAFLQITNHIFGVIKDIIEKQYKAALDANEQAIKLEHTVVSQPLEKVPTSQSSLILTQMRYHGPPEGPSRSQKHAWLTTTLKIFPWQLRMTIRPLLIILTISMVIVLFVALVLNHVYIPKVPPIDQPSVPLGVGADGIGVNLVNGEYIGISDGRYALDTNRPDGLLKEAAAVSLRAGNTAQANARWNSALQRDTNDAEALIYLEDQRVLASGNPYITIVVGTLLNSGDTYSRDILQGAYVKQEECDAPSNPCGVKIRLLIAKSGGDATHSKDIATQIVKAAHFDKTIVGVLGWPTTQSSLDAVQVLAQAHIPMISATASGDNLTGYSSYFFRVTSTSSTQAHLLAQYIEVKLKPQRVVVFEDQNEPYSEGLATAFITDYVTDDQHQIVGNQAVPFQTGGKAETLTQTVQTILQTDHPDVIFFTSINVSDMATLLNAIPDTPEFANVKVVMGSSGYSLVEAGEKFAGYDRIRFAATAFPDSWGALGRAKQNPVFFQDYPKAFDPNGTHVSSPYTFDRPTSYAMLGYDAASTFLKAYQILQQNKQTLTPENIRQAITEITGSMALQGITGTISFNTNGDAANKVALILRVDVHNDLQADAYQGCYFIDSPCSNTITLI